MSTRKNCEAVASVVARRRATMHIYDADALADDLADAIGRVAPEFNRAKFLAACGRTGSHGWLTREREAEEEDRTND